MIARKIVAAVVVAAAAAANFQSRITHLAPVAGTRTGGAGFGSLRFWEKPDKPGNDSIFV